MRRTALLIGAQTGGLEGVDHDVASMAGALQRHGFTPVTCTGDQANRVGILAAYDALIRGAEPGDACFVYYSGHGGLVAAPPEDPSAPERQFIVPSDFKSEGEFLGITSIELSVRLALLTRKTTNVAVAFDCCHSAHMTKDTDLRVRALLHKTPYERVTEHLARQVEAGLDLPARHVESNEHAVRIMACESQQSAFEYTNADGVRTGVMTESLVLALDEVGDLPVTWSTVAEMVRRRVTTLVSSQWPAAEGPSARLLFSTETGGALAALPVVPLTPERIEVRGAPLLNVQVGDRFAIMPAIAERADDATKLADAEVTELGTMTATATLQPAVADLPAGARAFRTVGAAPELAVGLPAAGPLAAALRARVEETVLIRPAAQGEEPAVEVRVDEQGRIAVHDRIGPLHPWHVADDAGLRTVIDNLQRQARATALRTLGDSDELGRPFPGVTLEWARVGPAGPEPLGLSGAVVHAGEKVFVRVHNGTDDIVFVSLIDIGLAAQISILTTADTSGIRLLPGADHTFGRDAFDGSVPGVTMVWPPGLEESAARTETVLAIITAERLDVSVLAQGGLKGFDPLRPAGSALEETLAQIATGGDRQFDAGTPRGIRYAVRGIDFTLSPAKPPEPEPGAFLVDERPEPSVRLLAPRGAGRSRHVAVRLDDLVVHHNRAMFGADVRVDALVLTGGGGVNEPVYHVNTERFSDVRDGDRLPLDKLLMYYGPATDYLDLAVWVTRDTSGSLALSDLLRKEFTSQEVQVAGAQLAGLALTAPHAALAVGALGAATVVVNVAYRLLLGVAGHSIGLYRTTLLAQEDFGIGPVPHFRRAQAFSFAYTITDVS
ncbi:caspase family protein [Dactylosporangium vinaceum]|uniref:Caspase family protein n=1 Tax=Dactylosporangium vinaceum TaxID=53362 RepID=A0ABV5MP61_9ACTN|nr:caspase family protein [Dactylosporangium vinaceum]UAB94508.1 caspase family protein [Dactylosporangium vinaceum]